MQIGINMFQNVTQSSPSLLILQICPYIFQTLKFEICKLVPINFKIITNRSCIISKFIDWSFLYFEILLKYLNQFSL